MVKPSTAILGELIGMYCSPVGKVFRLLEEDVHKRCRDKMYNHVHTYIRTYFIFEYTEQILVYYACIVHT